MKDICIIIPTIRDFGVFAKYVANARDHGFDTKRFHVLFITEDFCDKNPMSKLLRDLNIYGDVLNESDRNAWFKENELGAYSSVIPKRSHAETSFGLLWMWKNKEFEYGFFIDDDTEPHPDFDFFGEHMKNLELNGNVLEVSSDKGWVNVLFENFKKHRLYPRGYPYSCSGEKITIRETVAKNVVASQGLWTNVPDLDAVRILMDGDLNGQAKTRLSASDFEKNFIVKKGNYLTICSMNLAFRRDVIPAFYQLPMDDNPWRIGRFDDIWSGILLKKVCDGLGFQILSGSPLCIHNKAPRSTFKDIRSELAGIEISEYLYKVVDEVKIKSNSFFGAYSEIVSSILKKDLSKEPGWEFVKFVVEKMRIWLECIEVINSQ